MDKQTNALYGLKRWFFLLLCYNQTFYCIPCWKRHQLLIN